MAIIGNHEMWEFESCADCHKAYDDLFESVHIRSLASDSFITKHHGGVQFVFTGGCGFAGLNSEFNADNGIYRDVIDRTTELQLTEKFQVYYRRMVEFAKKECAILVFVSHFPVSD